MKIAMPEMGRGKTSFAPRSKSTSSKPASKPAPKPKPYEEDRRPRTESIELGRLEVDATYQRPLDLSRVKLMAANFDLNALASVRVNIRDDGRAFIIDGQQRMAALKLLGFGPEDLVDVLVQRGLTQEEEAREFVQADKRVALRHTDLWRARTEAGDKIATAINTILAEFGMKIAWGPNDGNIQAVHQIERIYTSVGLASGTRRGGSITHNTASATTRTRELLKRDEDKAANETILRAILASIHGAYGRVSGAYQVPILGGLAVLIAHGGAKVDRLVEVLSKYRGGYHKIVADARSLATLEGYTTGFAAARVIGTKYNTGIRDTSKRIDLDKMKGAKQ